MSLTKVSYSMINGAVVNVLDYGATGDGTTDDAAAVQLALNAGGTVFFPVGTYLIGTTLDVLSNTQVLLDQNATVKAKSTLSGNLFSVNARTNVKFTGGIFDGNKANAASATAVIYIYNSSSVWVNNTTVQNGKVRNINVEGPSTSSVSKNIFIQNNSINNATNVGITFTYTGNILIENNIVATNGAGLTSGESSYISIVGNSFFANTNDGCAVGNNCSFVTITGNVSESNGAEGINIDGVDHGVITGNTSYNNLIGISVWSRSPGTASSKRNVVSSNSVSSCTQVGIVVADGNDYTIVEGNSVNSCGSHGIQTGESNDLVIRDNIVNSNAGSGIYVTGSIGTKIEGNVCTDQASYGIRIEAGTGFGRNTITNNVLAANAGGYGIYDNGAGSGNLISNNVFTDESSPVVQTSNIYVNDSVVIESNRNLIGTSGYPNVVSGTIKQYLNSWQYASAAPTTGKWTVGDTFYNSAPTAGGTIGFVCITAGTPGTWKTWGAISA